jgi:hypothetical protein
MGSPFHRLKELKENVMIAKLVIASGLLLAMGATAYALCPFC